MSFLEKLDEDDILELESTINEAIYNDLSVNILLYLDKDFYRELTDNIFNIFFEEWKSADLCCDDDKDDIEQFLWDIVWSFFDIYDEFPRREYRYLDERCNIDDINKKIEIIKNIPQPKQRTMEWYEYRHNLLTASSIWKVFASESNQNSLIYEKCKPFDPIKTNQYKSASLMWGNIFEPLSIKIYEKKFSTKIEDFGCIQHPEYEFIGASPDGINVDVSSDKYGRMLEIKNIYNREINGIPKEEYWIQMQLQLETCDLELCDFLETRFIEYSSIEEFYNSNHEYKGLILYFTKNGEITYKYMPFEIEINEESINKWKTEEIEVMEKDNFTLTQENYWYLDEFSCVVVKRNKKWFTKGLEQIKEIWEIIQKEKHEGYEHRAAKKRLKQTDVYVSNDNDKHTIHNLNFDNKINLIKLL